jgi:hypothetical protein
MPDFIHIISKFFDHNRYLSFGALGAMILTIPACFPQYDGKVVSPVSGEMVSVDGLESDVLKEQKSLQDQYNENQRAINALAYEQEVLVEKSETLALEAGDAADLIEEEITNRNNTFGELLTVAGTVFPQASPALGPLSGLMGMLIGGGAVADNRRKNRLIKTLKT